MNGTIFKKNIFYLVSYSEICFEYLSNLLIDTYINIYLIKQIVKIVNWEENVDL